MEDKSVNTSICNFKTNRDYNDCSFPVYKNGKCILHCEKDEWIITKEPLLKFDKNKLKEFWDFFIENNMQDKIAFCGIIFPVIDYKTYFERSDIRFFECVFLGNCNLTQINELIFENCTFKANVFISPKCEVILFFNCHTIKHFSFHQLSPNFPEIINLKKLIIKDSSFKILSLQKVNFRPDSEVIIEWSENIIADRDTFRQLKLVNDLQGNHIHANRFYSLEMKEYKKELNEKFRIKGKDNKYKVLWYKFTNRDYWVFKISEISSDFSNNWLKPLILLLFVSILFFSLSSMVENANKFSFDLKTFNFSFWKSNFIKFIEYSNFFNTKAKGNIVIWIIHRIISLYLIYQFIIAARRQTKR